MRFGIIATTALCTLSVGFAAGQADSGRASMTSDTPTSTATAPSTAPTNSTDQLGWSRWEYLWWQFKDGPVPVLATRGGSFPAGLLGTPGSTAVLGGRDAEFDNASGIRLSGGLWLNAERTLAWETVGFIFDRTNFSESVGSDATGSPTLSRPFIDATTGALTGFAISGPGLIDGRLHLDMYSRLWGAESNTRATVSDSNGLRIDSILGVRYLGLDERLVATQFLTPLPATGGPAVLRDRFYTTNQFFGGQIGAEAEYQCDRWFVAAMGKVALGANCTNTEVSSGALLVLNTNRGEYEDTALAYAAEMQLRVGCNLGSCVRAYVGYNCLYWSNVGRPGDQIDNTINSTRLFGGSTGPSRPSFTLRDTDFWAHGASVGVELRY